MKISDFVADGKTDLVVAEGSAVGYKPVKGETMAPVSFKFFHALSKVKFTFVNGWRNNVTLSLSEAKLTNVINKGTLTTTGTLFTTPASSHTPMTNDAWVLGTDKFDYQADENDKLSSDKYGEEYVFEHFFMPQSIPSGEGAMVLSFTAQVNNISGSGPDLGNGAGRPATKTVVIPADVVSKWEPGKAYNYTLTVDGEIFGLKPIQFDNITVEPWVDATGDDLKEEAKPKD